MKRRPSLRALGLTPPSLRTADLLRESWLSVVAQPGRSLLTAIGIVLGSAAFVATLGVASTLTHQVSSSFDVRRATEVVVRPAADQEGAAVRAVPEWQTAAAIQRLHGLHGVTGAGRRMTLPDVTMRRTVTAGSAESTTRVTGVDPGAFDVIEPALTAGRTYDDFHEGGAAAVTLLPRNLAETLGVSRPGVAVFLNDRPFTVIGIFDDVLREPGTLAGAVVPFGTAQRLVAGPSADVTRDVIIEVAPGAAGVIGGQAPLALDPAAPGVLESLAPPDPGTLRREVEGDVVTMAVALSAVALAMGTISIGNAASAGIAARTPEIGLRRAVGAGRGHIFVQLLAETTMLGALGGLLGAASGIVTVVLVSLVNGWLPVVDLRSGLAGAAAGVLTGLLAGLAPAARATRIQPVSALQR